MFGKVQWVGGQRQTSEDQKNLAAIISVPGQEKPLKFYVRNRNSLGLRMQCSRCCLINSRRFRAGKHQLPFSVMRIDLDDNWKDDPLDVRRHCCGLQSFEPASMRTSAVKPVEHPASPTVSVLSRKRQRSSLPSNADKTFSPTTSFGEVSWARGRFNSLSPYIALPNQENPLRFVVSSRGTDGQLSVKCNRCVIRTVRNRRAGVKGMPMFLFTVKNNQWVHRNPLSSTWHCCGFDLSKTPSPVNTFSVTSSPIAVSPVKTPASPAPLQSQPNSSSKLSLEKSSNIFPSAPIPTFGDVFWTVGKFGGQNAYITLPGQSEPFRLCVSASNQGPKALTILKCPWCITLSARNRTRGDGGLRVVNFKVFNNQWVYHNPYDVKNHCCRFRHPTALRQSQWRKTSEKDRTPEQELDERNIRAKSPLLNGSNIDLDTKKESDLISYGQVEWTDKQRVCIRLTSRSDPITFHMHLRRDDQLMWVKCAECARLNVQRKKKGLKQLTKHTFMIRNNVWVGRDPRNAKWHGCRLLSPSFLSKNQIRVTVDQCVQNNSAKNLSQCSSMMTPLLNAPSTQPSPSTPLTNSSLNSSVQWKKNRETGQKYAFIETTPKASLEKVCFTFAKCLNEEDNTYTMSCLKCVSVNRKRLLQGKDELYIPNIKVVDQKWCEDPTNPTIPHICLTENNSSIGQSLCLADGNESSHFLLCSPSDTPPSLTLPKSDFGPVYWTPSFSKQDCLVVLAKSRVHANAIYKFYIPSQYRGRTPFYARCSYCEGENTRRRSKNLASLPIGKVPIENDRWIGDPDRPSQPHFCLQRARQPPSEIFEEVNGQLASQLNTNTRADMKQKSVVSEHLVETQKFGAVQWKRAHHLTTAMAVVKCERLLYEFIVMQRERQDCIARCYYCVAANQNRRRRGEALLPIACIAIHNDVWMQDPLKPTPPHICIPREPLVVQNKIRKIGHTRRLVKPSDRRIASSIPTPRISMRKNVLHANEQTVTLANHSRPAVCGDNMPSSSASPTTLSTQEPKRRRLSNIPAEPSTSSKKGDFGEVDWLHTKAESQLAVAHHNGQQLSFCIAQRTYSETGENSFAIGTCIANCLECKLVNQQRIKAGLPLLPLPQLKIVNNRWHGQHPFSPHISHFCAASSGKTSVEEEVQEVQIVQKRISIATPTEKSPIANTPSMARPTSRKSAVGIASTRARRSKGDKENSGSVTRDREPRSAAKNAMNALLSLTLSNKRNKKARSILQEKQNLDENTPIRPYKLVLQNNVIDCQDEESEVETFDTNEPNHSLSIRNSTKDRLLKDQGSDDQSIICISDEDEVREEEVRESLERKCKRNSREQQSRAGSSSSMGSNFFVLDMSSTKSPSGSFFSSLGGSVDEMPQTTSSTEEVEEEELNTEEIDHQNGVYEVDKVLAARHHTGREMEYLLKWKNYAYAVSTWEKSQFVQECKELILEFTKRERLREVIAASMKAFERPLYSQGHTASAFFSLHRWEDEMNEVLIASGQAPLMVENWVDTYGRPKNFKFITTNTITAGALAIMEHPQIVPCLCLQGCISSRECCPDVICYTSNNRIRKNFNFEQNWLVECSNECACGIDCQTRVVQRGRRIPIIIFRTYDRGWSVRTAVKIPNNTFVMEYVGEVITMEESKSIKSATYQFDMDACGADKCAFVVDAMHNGNEARFVNHSCDPNMIVRGVFCDRLDNRYLRLAFFAIKDIEKGEEITINYFSKMDNNAYAKKTKNRTQKSCFCKAKNCRGYII